MALARALARDPTITRYLMGFTSWRLSPSALQQRFTTDKGDSTALEDESVEDEEALVAKAEVLKREVVGSNLFRGEGANVEIKPDSDYPDWLWKLHLGKPLEPHEMDPNTKQYWLRVYKLGRLREKEINELLPYKRIRK